MPDTETINEKPRPIPTLPKFTFEVTAEIIQRAVRADKGRCMVADAFQAAYPNLRNCEADDGTVRATDPKKSLRYTYFMPPNVSLALLRYDCGELPEPFMVHLRKGIVTYSQMKDPQTKTSPRSEKLREAAREKRARLKERLRQAQLVQADPYHTTTEIIGGRAPLRHPGRSNRRIFGACTYAKQRQELFAKAEERLREERLRNEEEPA